MFLFSQGNRGSERLSGLPKFISQINSCPWIQTWVCSAEACALFTLSLPHNCGPDSLSRFLTLSEHLSLGLWCYSPLSSWIVFRLSFPGMHPFWVLSSLLRCSPAWPLGTYSTHLFLVGPCGFLISVLISVLTGPDQWETGLTLLDRLWITILPSRPHLASRVMPTEEYFLDSPGVRAIKQGDH